MSLKTIRGTPTTPDKLLFQQLPISLDPVAFQYVLVYGSDDNLYASDGISWNLAGTGGNQGIQGIQGVQGFQGIQGNFGPAINIIGSESDVNYSSDPQAVLNANFPGAAVGNTVVDQALNELWAYTGSSTWVNIGDFRGTQGTQGAQGIDGGQGIQGTANQGRQGIQGIQGIIGEQGVQGIDGTLGSIGAQGVQGITGEQGVQGITGEQGIQGITGEQGVQGITGEQGIQGIDGTIGVQGIQGIQGITGEQGVQGLEGARDINVDSSGNIAYLIDFSVSNADIKLIRGFTYRFIVNASGHPFYIKTSATTGTGDQYTAGVTGNGTEVGTVTFAVPYNAPNTLYYQCSIHSAMGGELQINDVGPQGIQGITGAGTQGNQGITGAGEQGIQGITGEQGIQGTDGTGNQGIQGITGIGTQGIQGRIGIQGPLGLQGTQGEDGEIGTQGIVGNTGSQGIQGITGAGSQGISGATGAQGIQGADGIGFSGTQGTAGEQGIQGITGVGSQGIQGVTGAQGVQGITGEQGIQGITGDQGIQGVTGEQGVQGITGAGTQGIQGITGGGGAGGAQGIQGIQGITGAGTQGIQGITGGQGIQGGAAAASPATELEATNDTSTDASFFPVFVQNVGAVQTINATSTKLYFNPSTGTLSATNFNSLSDVNAKTDFMPIPDLNNILNQISTYKFKWKDNGTDSYGVIAQELEQVLPALVTNMEDKKYVNYIPLIAFLIEGYKQLAERVTTIEGS